MDLADQHIGTLTTPAAREPQPAAEPDVAEVNGRKSVDFEQPAIREGLLAQRAEADALLAGLTRKT